MNANVTSRGLSPGRWGLVLLLVGSIGAIIFQQTTLSKLRQELEPARAQSQELEGLRAEHADLERLRAENQQIEQLRRDNQDLHKLRNEVRQLREQKKELARLQADNQRLQTERQAQIQNQAQAETQAAQAEEAERVKAEYILKMNNLKQVGLAFIMFAQDNQGVLPKEFAHSKPFMGKEFFEALDWSRYEITASGLLSKITEPAKTPLVRERQKDARGCRGVVFADGHSEIRCQDPD